MKNSTMSLHDVFVIKLQALLDIEQELVKALPKMSKAASNQELKESFDEHLEETREHVKRLEEALSLLGEEPEPLKGDAIRGLIKDAEWVIENTKGDAAKDAHLIAAANFVEHYEMAGYESALSWAEEMDHDDVADLLRETLDEEEAASGKLQDLALSEINPKANDSENESEE